MKKLVVIVSVMIGVALMAQGAWAATNSFTGFPGARQPVVQPPIIRGTIDGYVKVIATHYITVIANSRAYSVRTSSATRFLDANDNPMERSQIQAGDKVRVYGIITFNRVRALGIKDFSFVNASTTQIDVPTPEIVQ
jgi:hypothetical protein